eukprot:COSAG06_NODE_1920_length_8063_cov_14.050854_12_plen_63_part_00
MLRDRGQLLRLMRLGRSLREPGLVAAADEAGAERAGSEPAAAADVEPAGPESADADFLSASN